MSYALEQRKLEVRQYLETIWKSPQETEQSMVPDSFTNPHQTPSFFTPGQDLDASSLTAQTTQDFLPCHVSVRQLLQASLPDLHFTLLEVLVAEEETVVARWSIQGTDLGGYEGHLPTGRPVTLKGITLMRMEGQSVVEEYSETNLAELQRQLGFVALPTPRITIRRPRSHKSLS